LAGTWALIPPRPHHARGRPAVRPPARVLRRDPGCDGQAALDASELAALRRGSAHGSDAAPRLTARGHGLVRLLDGRPAGRRPDRGLTRAARDDAPPRPRGLDRSLR